MNKLNNSTGFWVFLFVCFFPFLGFSQTYSTRNFTIQDGLPSNAVHCIYKDSRNLLWIGTDAGLCTFNGKEFQVFNSSDGISANMIWSITEDGDGNMWFGSYGDGVWKYDGNQFVNFTQKDGLADNNIRKVCYSQKHNCVVAAAGDGIHTFLNDTIFGVVDKTPDNKQFGLITDVVDAGDFMFLTSYCHNNPLKYYPKENRLVSLGKLNKPKPYSSFATYITSHGDTILSYDKIGVQILQKDTIIKNMEMGQVFGIDEDKNGNLWFAAWTYPNMELFGGIFMYDGAKFENYNSLIGITERGTWTVFCDKEQDVLWIGTLNQGLFMISNTGFTNYHASHFHPKQKKINNVLFDSKNRLWVSGDEELVIMDKNASFSRMTKLQFVNAYRKYWEERKNEVLLCMQPTINRVSSLTKISSEEFINETKFNYHNVIESVNHSFIISNELGVFRYEEELDDFQFITPDGVLFEYQTMGDTMVFSGWSATAILPNYATEKIVFNKNDGFAKPSFVHFTKDRQPRNVNRLVKQDNSLWYASWESGLWMSIGEKLINFNKSDSTLNTNLNDLCFDRNGNIVFGSNTGEICIGSYIDDTLMIDYRYSKDEGLQGTSISWLLVDHNNLLWVGTNQGLNCIDLNKLYSNGNIEIQFWNEEDGYNGKSSERAVVDNENVLWIASNEHLVKVETSKILASDTKLNSIFLKSLEINNESIENITETELDPWTSLPLEKQKLNHSENDIIFHFDAINYKNPKKDLFRYQLVGYDKEWSKWNTERKAVYTNLSSGKYSFKVESHNLQSLQKSKPLVYEFSIRPPWWKLWYFQLFALLSLIGLTIIITRRITISKRIKQEEKAAIEKRIVELEIQALQAQMNPHFIFNCMNNIQYYILDNKSDEALSYLSDFSKVVRFSLENATLDSIALEQEISYLESYIRLEYMRFPDKFDYKIGLKNIKNPINIHIPPSLIQPFIENAIKHGFNGLIVKGKLKIDFEIINNHTLRCTIKDNGNGRGHKGRHKEQNPEDDRVHSTSITETRIELFNSPETRNQYRIDFIDLFEAENPCGLKVEIYIPMVRK